VQSVEFVAALVEPPLLGLPEKGSTLEHLRSLIVISLV